MIGQTIGPYTILAKLGEGGMGEVYRARDTKLNRDVAIKVLPESFANDPDRLARFEREAQVLASLNHPNIAHIHGLEDSGGAGALVMELVEGDDLSVMIARGAIPFAEALPIAKQIADALEAAHELGNRGVARRFSNRVRREPPALPPVDGGCRGEAHARHQRRRRESVFLAGRTVGRIFFLRGLPVAKDRDRRRSAADPVQG